MDKVKTVGATAAMLLLAGAATEANATETLTLTINQLLSNSGASYSGQFDISSFLAPTSGGHFQITGATVAAYGYSDRQISYTGTSYGSQQYTGSYTYQSGGYSYSYSCDGGWSTCYGYVPYYATTDYYQESDVDYQFDAVTDEMRITTGAGNSGTGDSQYQSVGLGSYGYANSYGSYYSGGSQISHYVDVVGEGNFGAMSAGTVLSLADLANANSSGLFQFAVQNTNGQFNLNQVQLSFDLTQLPEEEAGVPEPATWAMMLAGFGAVGAMARSRKKKGALAG